MAWPGLACSGFQVCSRSSSISNARRATLSSIIAASTCCSADSAPESIAASRAAQPSTARRSSCLAGTVPAADVRMLAGVVFGRLGAAPEARNEYYELVRAPEFGATIGWADLDPGDFDGLILPGGHAPGMRQSLGSAVLAEQVARFW